MGLKMLKFISVFLLFVVAFCGASGFTENERIINGEAAKRREFPFMALIYKNNRQVGSGAIISDLWVVTSAQTAYKQPYPSNLVVYAGILDQGEYHNDIQKVPVDTAIVHPGFVPEGSYPNDIALLRLTFPLRSTPAVDKINLPGKLMDIEDNTSGITLGWGFTSINPSMEATRLQYFYGDVLNQQSCQSMVDESENIFEVADTNICIISSESSVCKRDIGPLIVDNVLVGLGSIKHNCNPGLPGIFTRVASYVDFIADCTGIQ